MENFSGERMPIPEENTGEEIEQETTEDKIERQAEQFEKPENDLEATEKLLQSLMQNIESVEFDSQEEEIEKISTQLNELMEILSFIARDVPGNEFEVMQVMQMVPDLYDISSTTTRLIREVSYDRYPDMSLDERLDDISAKFPFQQKIADVQSVARRNSTFALRSLSEKDIVFEDIDYDKMNALLVDLQRLSSHRYSSAVVFESFMKRHGAALKDWAREERGSGDSINDHKNLMADILYSFDYFDEEIIRIIQNELHENRGYLGYTPDARERVLNFYVSQGLDGEDILDALYGRTEGSPEILYNISAIRYLEETRPGVAKLLREKFGIRHFERYPMDLLTKQAEQIENTEIPYGIVMNPTSDHNDAFGYHHWIWGKLGEQLEEQGYALRILEGNGKLEVVKKLLGLNKKYGENHKISFAIIGGHGGEHAIGFGPWKGDKGSLLQEDLLGKGAPRTSQFFEPNPTIVLVSCSTGVEGGIAQQLSETLDARVIAPDVPTNLSDINVTTEEGQIKFNIEYWDKNYGRAFAKGIAE
jgi:hypothetical protein